jgi:DNA mismatch repair protein MutL
VPTIRILPDHLASQIAAGEVVERPASVLKELVENALDAGATTLEIDLEMGGRRRIAVADDGTGMDRSDALLAFDRHATSKIASFEDLERVATLGFRGEALASIASVAKVELVTAPAVGEGTRVLVEGGRIAAVEPAARPRGTTIDVRSLFFNVPARRKFLKTPETELRRCLDVVQGYALARSDVRLRLRHEGRLLLDLLPAQGSSAARLRERVQQVFGDSVARELVELPAAAEWVGWVGKTSAARGRRPVVLINGRLVRDRAVSATFYRAVREAWRSDDPPALFLTLTLDPSDLDVNVHPQKAEVRFRDPRLLDRLGDGFLAGLANARGVEPAWAKPLESLPPGRLAWSGLGGGSSMVAEPPSEAALKLAEVSYSPLPERPPTAEVSPWAESAASRSPLSGRFGEIRSLRVLGQYKGTLILLEGPEGLYLVDQHVAHERILYERLRVGMAQGNLVVQHLLEPVWLGVSVAEARRLAGAAEALETSGFLVRAMSGDAVALTGHPQILETAEAEAMLVALAGREDEIGSEPVRLRREILDARAASSACKAAVKMHHAMSIPALEAMIGELFGCEQPYSCPHGRPIFLELPDRDLERWFQRR